jgi:hypothetical protein
VMGTLLGLTAVKIRSVHKDTGRIRARIWIPRFVKLDSVTSHEPRIGTLWNVLALNVVPRPFPQSYTAARTLRPLDRARLAPWENSSCLHQQAKGVLGTRSIRYRTGVRRDGDRRRSSPHTHEPVPGSCLFRRRHLDSPPIPKSRG